VKRIIKILFYSITTLALIASAINPQLFKIAWYQKPNVDTYKQFPTRKMNPSAQIFSFPEHTVGESGIDSLEVINWEGKRISFLDYFEKGNLLAFLVIKNDTLVYEKYSDGYARNTISNTFSIGKTMISILVGKAIELGYIKSTEQKVIDILPEFKGNPYFDTLTIEDLLNMKSGLKFKRAGDDILSDLFCDEARFYYTNNLKRDLLKVKFDTRPGVRWKYSNLDPLLLTWVLEKVSKKYVSDLFEQEIWKPIGAEFEGSWGIDRENGLENSPSSFQCTAIDLAKIGRLYLHNGKRDSLQILSPEWINKSTHIKMDNKANTAKGWQKATHQYEGDFSAEGLRGQRLYVNPRENIIIVQFAKKGYGGYPYRTIARHFSKNNN